ncbi:MAG: zinc metalloprotease, partial [Maribacter sp.]|nr:zinc metalloprotease [Maribacter sp.]
MRKLIFGLAMLAVVVSCEQNQSEPFEEAQEIQIDMSDFTLYADDDLAGKSADAADKCHSMKNLAYRLDKNPGLAKKMYDIEYNTRKLIAAKKPDNPGGGNGNGNGGGGDGGGDPVFEGTVIIPVIVNIIEQT